MSNWFIDIADVVFFKDGREIAPGSEYSASSIFPPNPVTVYGAIRSALLSSDSRVDFYADGFGDISQEIRRLAGNKRKHDDDSISVTMGDLRIYDFGLACLKDNKVEPLYPLPGDILTTKKAEKGEEAVFSAGQIDLKKYGIRTNMPEPITSHSWVSHTEGSFFEYHPVYLTQPLWENYLLNDLDEIKALLIDPQKRKQLSAEQFFTKEPRMGIVIDKETGTVEEGKLFTTPFIRLNNYERVGFRIMLNKELQKMMGEVLVRLGGDGKLAALRSADEYYEEDFKKTIGSRLNNKGEIKLVLTTPAIFENGWMPDGFDPETGMSLIAGVKVKLTGASIGRFQLVGGWDAANNLPKPSKRAVPAGTVYYLRCEKGSEEILVEALHGQSICENEDYQKQGIGIIQTGVV